jgi:hypothetical protein
MVKNRNFSERTPAAQVAPIVSALVLDTHHPAHGRRTHVLRCGKTTDAAARHKFPWPAHRRPAPQIEAAATSHRFAVALLDARAALMTLSSCAPCQAYDVIIMFRNAFGALLPRCLRSMAATKVFEITAETSETGLGTTPSSRRTAAWRPPGKQPVARRLRSNTYCSNKIEGSMRTARSMVDKYRSAASRWLALVLSETDVQAYSATGDGIVFGE